MDLNQCTIEELKQECEQFGVKSPNGLTKNELVHYVYGLYSEQEKGIDHNNRVRTVIGDLKIVPKPFEGDFDDWEEHLVQHGWSLVKIPDFDSASYVDKFYNWLESCNANFKRDDPSTWINANMPSNIHGIFKHYIGHLDFVWEIREKCLPIFAQLWGTEQLLCSFDGGCFLKPIPPHVVNHNKQWIHSDQPRYDNRFICVQGVVNLLDNGPQDGGLVIVEGSHRLFEGYMERHPTDGIMWQAADMNDPELAKCPIIKICAPAGYLLLWDSRTFHCNYNPSGEKPRMCTYVSMSPREGVDEATLKKRQKYYEEGRMTGHWTANSPWFKMNPKEPRTYGGPNNKPEAVEIATLNEVQRGLVGY